METTLDQKVEAVLFMRGEPISRKELAKAVGAGEAEVTNALAQLSERLAHGALALVETEELVALGTKPELARFLADWKKEELGTELGKAGLETLAIVAYEGPVSASRIEYIRGVNSRYTIRHLMIRGLIERITNPEDPRSFLYKPTLETIAHLGLTNVADLPEYGELKAKLDALREPVAETPNNL